MEPELLLRGVFAHLVANGVPLGMRDYLDALRALRAGHGGYTRARLLWLCCTLWARTEAEARAITLLFDQLPPPSDDEVTALSGSDARAHAPAPAQASPGPKAPAAEAQKEPGVSVAFAPVAHGGVGLPRARAEPASGELFILTPRPVVPLRSLVIVWRRFRTALRVGPPVELNLEATIDAKCRTGLLTAPALVPARRNQARVVVLVDASLSMQPWRDLGEVMRASLTQSQLGGWALRFFVNVPDELCADEHLRRPEPVDRLLRQHPDSTLLVVSDAGAARGSRDTGRVRETARFLAHVSPAWRPVAWVNPMSRARWKGTAAEQIAALRGVSMFEMTDDGLVQAVDVLRGRGPC